MFAIIKMEFRSYFQNPSWFFSVIFPIIMITVLGSVFTSPGALNNQTPEQVMLVVMGNVVVISVMSTIGFAFGQNFMELKESAIIKRLGATDITKTEAMFGFMLWAVLLTLYQVFYVMFLVFFTTNLTGLLSDNLAWNSIDWAGFFYGIIMLIVLSFTLTFLFISLSKTAEIYGLFTFTYFFFALYFGGLIFPGSSIEWMNILSLFIPHTYVSHFFAGAMNGGNYSITVGNEVSSIWNINNYSYDYVKNGISSLNIFMPWIFAALAGFFAVKNFKWD